MLFILSMNFTEEGVRGLMETPKRLQRARDVAQKMGVEVKQVYLTTGEADLIAIIEAPSDESAVKCAMALSMLGVVRTRTARAWPMEEYPQLMADLPSL